MYLVVKIVLMIVNCLYLVEMAVELVFLAYTLGISLLFAHKTRIYAYNCSICPQTSEFAVLIVEMHSFLHIRVIFAHKKGKLYYI